MEIISIIGMVAALALLSFLVMKGVNIFIAAIASSLLVAVTGQIGLYDALQTNYMGGFTGFFGGNFLIFAAGALMGQVYEKTNGAKAIARMIIKGLGKGAAIVAVPLAIGILTYGGIAGFVVCFAVFPIALEIYREADIPRRFIPGVIVFACCTFSAVGPGNPQVGNVVLQNALGTSLMAGATVGFIVTGVTLVVGVVILNVMIKKAWSNGEHFAAKDTDRFDDEAVCPNGWLALVPMIFTLVLINIKINGQAVCPTAFGVVIGAALAWVLLNKYKTPDAKILELTGNGIKNAVTAAANTSAVVGFGSVVKGAAGFPVLCSAIENIPGPPLVAVALATTLIAGICGSGSGGLGIAAPILKPIFVDGMGVNINVLHRMMMLSSTGLDSMPHNGFVVTVINGVCGETHKDAYMPVFWLTVITPLIATAVGVILFTLFPNLP